MGLDVYLYRYENKEKTDAIEKQYEEQSEKNWEGEYDTLTDVQKETARAKDKKLAEELGLGQYGQDEGGKTCIEIPSKIDPEHYFKVGYFRSSYNDGGINRILRNLELPTLDDVFNAGGDYCFQPDWESALQKTKQVIESLSAAPNLRCFHVSPNMFANDTGAGSEQEALNIATEQLSKEAYFDSGYSNSQGHFYPKGVKVLAIIPGTTNIFRQMPCSYIVCEGENQWYITALKIVQETIEYVLAQPDTNKYYLHWSG